jgi:XRE family transcriptional regulator, fatty acid utilization regulator
MSGIAMAAMRKTFIGPHMRRLRQERGETQGQMARRLGVSAAYVNLLENNQRSVSVAVLLRLFQAYGVDWQDIAEDDSGARLADLRARWPIRCSMARGPTCTSCAPRISHAPTLLSAFLRLHGAYQATADQLLALAEQGAGDDRLLTASPEGAVHHFFRRHRNHFPSLELAAEGFWPDRRPATDDLYAALKDRLRSAHGIKVRVVPVADLPLTLRQYDSAAGEVLLSEAMDHPNRVFQLVHVLGLIERSAELDALLAGLEGKSPQARPAAGSNWPTTSPLRC